MKTFVAAMTALMILGGAAMAQGDSEGQGSSEGQGIICEITNPAGQTFVFQNPGETHQHFMSVGFQPIVEILDVSPYETMGEGLTSSCATPAER